MNRKTLLIHMGLQHSHQLAWALHDRGLLDAFWSGVPVRTSTETKPLALPQAVWRRMKSVDVPSERRRAMPWWWLVMRIATRTGSRVDRFKNMHRVLHAFDRATAPRVQRLQPAAVVAYESAALHTFKAARANGGLCILDAASFHFETGNRLLPSPAPDFQAHIDDWKRQEIEMADHIICCSELARESYLRAGVPPDKLTALPLGASLPIGDFSQLAPPTSGPVRFAYAGSMQTRKSIDLILKVFEKLQQHQPARAKLHIYGGSDGIEWIAKAESLSNVKYHGAVPQSQLYEALAQCHCLLLPSRFDSFGMVVPEAMAVGTPALVSDQTGAKMIIEQHPGAGWIIEAQPASLETAIRRLIDQPELLAQARPAAKAAAAEFTWSAYRQRAADLFENLFYRRVP